MVCMPGSPCNGNTLLFTTTELEASLPHHCVVAVWHGHDGIMDLHHSSTHEVK